MAMMSLSFFAAATGEDPAGSPYSLLLDSAKLADEAGLEAVWLPERHFADFGGLYPNPSVTAAAVAATTRRIGIRAGSVVLPLHHPARVAEEWAMVDQLSGGRVGVSFASGWHGGDFVLSRFDAADRRTVMRTALDQVRALWRGESLDFPDAAGRTVTLGTMPRPVQPELPVWVTSGGARPTFELAGTLGCGVLTHLVGQDPEALSANIAAYRKTRSAAGDGRGHVTLMLHTHVHDGSAAATERAEAELARYLTSSMRLDASNTADPGTADAMRNLNSADRGAIAGLGAARYLDLGLICTSAEVPQRLAAIDSWDVDEIACLIDFGFDHGTVMRSLDELLTVLA